MGTNQLAYSLVGTASASGGQSTLLRVASVYYSCAKAQTRSARTKKAKAC